MRPVFLLMAALPWSAAAETSPIWRAEVDEALQTVFAAIDSESARFSGPARSTDREWVTQKLQHMVDIDQTARNAFTGPKVAAWETEAREYFIKKLDARMDQIDRANTAELKELLKIHGWFTISKFGKRADQLTWLLVQHADQDSEFQREVLGILAGLYSEGETSPSNYAYLWDRVAVNTGKK